MTAPTGPAIRPIATIVSPWTTRNTAAERATPIHRLTSPIPAEPAAAANHAPELTGPMIAPASVVPPTSSESRIGKRLSKATIENPQNSSTATSAIKHPRVAQHPQAVADHGRYRSDRRRDGPNTPGHPDLVHEQDDRHEVGDPEGE